jgi:[histone H3]-lysine36 N-dimethyltransferase SETMAR
MQRSAGKVMASVFWDARGIIIINYFDKGHPINSEYNIKKKRNHLKKKKRVISSKQCQKSIKTTVKLHKLGYELLPHPPYSPHSNKFCVESCENDTFASEIHTHAFRF